MKKLSFLLVVIVLLAGMSSCTHRLTDFTVISTKNVPLGKEVASLQKANQRVKGVDRSHIILFIPIGSPNMKEAIDRAIEKYPGAIGLADGVVKSKGWSALLYGQSSYVVEGTPIYEADVKDTDISSVKEQAGDSMMFFHEVKEGDTLPRIASSYNVKIADIIKWNQLSSDVLIKGTKLKIVVR
ncbi:MAG: LysM peptidoglycan-binding domain-containing protein [Muribaculaceae bacterium]